jgi:hypothetical protein
VAQIEGQAFVTAGWEKPQVTKARGVQKRIAASEPTGGAETGEKANENVTRGDKQGENEKQGVDQRNQEEGERAGHPI